MKKVLKRALLYTVHILHTLHTLDTETAIQFCYLYCRYESYVDVRVSPSVVSGRREVSEPAVPTQSLPQVRDLQNPVRLGPQNTRKHQKGT